MAATQLGSKALMSIIKIKENNVAQEFYIVRHNAYTSGRTLLLRRYIHSDRQWNRDVSAYAGASLDVWFNGDYFNSLPADVQGQIAAVTIPYTPGNGNNVLSSLSRKVFALSTTEYGFPVHLCNVEGTALANASTLKIATNSGGTAKDHWTRTPLTNDDESAWRIASNGNLGSDNTGCHFVYGVRPAFTLPASLYVLDDGSLTTNTAPSTPTSITVPSSIFGGTTIAISWGASTDAQGNLTGYTAERSINGGSTWSQIYQGSATSTSNLVAFGTVNVMYRVKAYDRDGLQSAYKTSGQVTVINNVAPSAPTSINVPSTVNGGKTLSITWGVAADTDGNLSSYTLERSQNSGSWTQVYSGANTTFTDNITAAMNTVQYRVKAIDSYGDASGYTTSPTRTVIHNLPPSISGANGNLGSKKDAFVYSYTVTDPDNNAVTVVEKVDGTLIKSYTAQLGKAATMKVEGVNWVSLTQGSHTLTITATDTKNNSCVRSMTFTKQVSSLYATLEAPLPAVVMPTRMNILVHSQVPAGANIAVMVCNNANDPAPAWEEATHATLANHAHVFTNKAKQAAEWGVNIKVTIERKTAIGVCTLTGIKGNFE